MTIEVSRRDGMVIALAGASAVLLGASGAHALQHVLTPAALAIWHTAVEYQFWHVLALVLAVIAGQGRAGRLAVHAFTLGIVLFSGSLYALALGAPHWVGFVTPFGGIAFVLGWIALGLGLKRG